MLTRFLVSLTVALGILAVGAYYMWPAIERIAN